MNEQNGYFLSITEVSKKLDLPSHILRFWEKQFPMIKPVTGRGGRRYYRENDLKMLAMIKDLLYKQGYTIRGVKKILLTGGGAMVANAADSSVGVAELSPVSGDEVDQAIALLLNAKLMLTGVD